MKILQMILLRMESMGGMNGQRQVLGSLEKYSVTTVQRMLTPDECVCPEESGAA